MIVTRFAPSPTGYLHIGGARTALFCWLLARRHNGKMILRLEDTDLKRNTPTAAAQVINDLRWLGIDWDEGPDPNHPDDPTKSIGTHGPYFQSQRCIIYDKYLQQLLDAGKAYYCFDTPEQIQVLRDRAAVEKKTFLYPRPQNFPDAKEAQKAHAQGCPVVIRFALPNKPITVNDVVRGRITFSAEEISDFIIRKSDGFPTYHFACVVDDELMEVTHIIRGQEHLMNTPLHLALQQALGFRTPTYAHMSVTVSEGGGKLSKRERAKTLLKAIKDNPHLDLDALAAVGSLSRVELDAFLVGNSSPDQPHISAMAEHLHVHLPEINVIDFFQSGYLPEALVNFIALLGWSPGDNREIMPLADLIAAFDLQRLTKTNSLFDRQKLVAFNTEHLRLVPPDKLLQHFKNYLKVNNSPITAADDATLAQLLKISEGARTFEQIEQKCLFLFTDKIEYDLQAVKKILQKPGAPDLLTQTRAALANLETWDEPSLHRVIELLCEKNHVSLGKIAQPLRVAVTGTTISPPIGDSLTLLGKERTLKRIDDTLEYLKRI